MEVVCLHILSLLELIWIHFIFLEMYPFHLSFHIYLPKWVQNILFFKKSAQLFFFLHFLPCVFVFFFKLHQRGVLKFFWFFSLLFFCCCWCISYTLFQLIEFLLWPSLILSPCFLWFPLLVFSWFFMDLFSLLWFQVFNAIYFSRCDRGTLSLTMKHGVSRKLTSPDASSPIPTSANR